MTFMPVLIFLLGVVMGVVGTIIVAYSAYNNAKKREEEKSKKALEMLNDDLIRELFKEFLKDQKNSQ